MLIDIQFFYFKLARKYFILSKTKTRLMKKAILLCILFLSQIQLFAQDYSKTDNIVANYPKTFSSPNQLATLIKNDFSDQSEKARAIFTWISLNIKFDSNDGQGQVGYRYSSEKERIEKEKQFKKNQAVKTISKGAAGSIGYTSLFQELCGLLALECVSVNGFLKARPEDIGVNPQVINHIWNAVKINNSWKLIDVTLAAGYLDQGGKFKTVFNDGYFCTEPEMFFLNHFPQEEKWLMVKKSKEDFMALPLFYGDYLKCGFTVSTPFKGKISVKDDLIIFKFKGLYPGIPVAYFTDGLNELQIMEQNEETLEHKAIINKATDHFITLYIDNKLIATYKII